MRAIVLSGGGAKGAYQIGVWRALKKMKIDYQIITGTSIGAFNGALMVQDDYNKAKLLWENMDYSFLFGDEINIDKKPELLKKYVKELIKHGGLSAEKVEKSVYQNLQVEKFYQSPINYGLITYDIKNLKPVSLTKKQIKKDQLADYIMASAACFPFFKQKVIEQKKYIDGSYTDTLPINLAIDMGATEIIAIDLKGISIRKKVKKTSAKIIYIKPQNRLESFLNFRKDIVKRQMRLGYNDTFKKFKKLDGKKFTFKENELSKIYQQLQNKPIFKNNFKNKQELFDIIELLGKVFGLDDSKIYEIEQFNICILKQLKKTSKSHQKIFIDKIKSEIVSYIFDNYQCSDKIKQRIINQFKKEYLCASYLQMIKKVKK